MRCRLLGESVAQIPDDADFAATAMLLDGCCFPPIKNVLVVVGGRGGHLIKPLINYLHISTFLEM